jgi:PAS domain S-box-containing protein
VPAILDTIDALIVVLDVAGRILTFNQGCERATGFPCQEVHGRPVWDVLIPAEERDAVARVFGRLRDLQIPSRYKNHWLAKGGGRRLIAWSNTVVRADSGDTLYVVGTGIDITERDAAESALRESEQRLRLVIEAVHDYAIFTLDTDGRVTTWNSGAQRMYGYEAAEIVGADASCLFTEEDRRAGRPSLSLNMALAGRLDEESWRVRKDRSRIRVHVIRTPLRDDDGVVRGVVSVMQDVTERRAADEALRESEARLQAIVRTAADAIVTIDERGTIESVNSAGERMFGYGSGELDGRRVTALMPEPFRSGHDDYVARYLRTGEAKVIGRKCEGSGRRKDGATFPIELSVSEVRLAGGRRLFTAIIHDLTSRKRLEREILEVSGNEQRRIGQDLHDGLCQHLTGIAFACQAMVNELDDADPKQARRLEKIRTMVDEAIGQARRLARGLQPVLVGPHALPTALKELSRNAQELFDVSCRFTCYHDVPDVDQPAATHLYRIAQEAITNAVRHGRAERILVRLSMSDGGNLRLIVKDNGVGMAAVPGEGPGMGMHIMRYRAAVIGASLAIESHPGAGTTVTCTLPTNDRSSHEIDYSL